MTVITGINTATTTTGAREHLTDTITRISPEETPLYTNARKVAATAINHEWQTDTLDNATINAQIEGDTVATTSAAQTTRLGNILQISRRSYGVSRTIRQLDLAGRSDELIRLRMKKGLELRRDQEVVLHTNQAKVAATGDTTARKLAGLPAWITAVTGSTDAAGPTTADGGSAAGGPTSTTATAVTYEMISSAMQIAYTAGGNPSLIELPPLLKRKFSLLAFGSAPSTAQIRYNIDSAGAAVAVGTVEKWQSDFGLMDIIVNRQLKNTAATFLNQAIFGLEPEKIAVAELTAFEYVKLAKTGDADQEFVVSEYTLQMDSPAAHFGVYGLNG